MTERMILYDLSDRSRRCIGPYSWRVREALLLLGIEHEDRPLRFDEIPQQYPGLHRTVPILVDGDTHLSDSWKILCYLADNHDPQGRLFGDADRRRFMTFLVRWVDAALMAAVNSMIILDTHDCLAPTEQENFRKRQEKHLGGTLESLQGQRESVLPKFQIALHPARSILKESEYLGGARPGCGDVVLHAVFKWCTQVSRLQLLREDDSLRAWTRRMDKLLGLGQKRDSVNRHRNSP